VEIDPRGPRFGAMITTVVLATVLITGSVWLLAAQALVFAVGAVFGLRYAPYGVLYRKVIRPRLGPAVGLVFAVIGVAGYATGLTWLGLAATAAAFAAAFLNGFFGFCLGCQMYVLIRRIRPGRQSLVPAGADKEV